MHGKILDGRRRWKACHLAGTEPQTEEVEADDPVAYVLSLNLHRRHLDTSQRAMVAARAREIFDREAKERIKVGAIHGAKSGHGQPVANLPEAGTGRSRDKAAAAVNVGGRTVDAATRVLQKGVSELVEAVDSGKVAVSRAAAIATLPKAEQSAAIKEATGNTDQTA